MSADNYALRLYGGPMHDAVVHAHNNPVSLRLPFADASLANSPKIAVYERYDITIQAFVDQNLDGYVVVGYEFKRWENESSS